MSSDEERRRVRGVLIGSAIGALVVATFGWLIGVRLVNCGLLVAAVLTVGLLRLFAPPGLDQSWPEHPESRRDTGARREVSRLSWSLYGVESRVDPRSVARLRTAAAVRLAQRGLDLDDDEAACRALLGDTACRVLTSEPFAPPRYDHFVQALAAVERLTDQESLR